eukprot:365048-Chlamydomonas_euryale.AAC.8
MASLIQVGRPRLDPLRRPHPRRATNRAGSAARRVPTRSSGGRPPCQAPLLCRPQQRLRARACAARPPLRRPSVPSAAPRAPDTWQLRRTRLSPAPLPGPAWLVQHGSAGMYQLRNTNTRWRTQAEQDSLLHHPNPRSKRSDRQKTSASAAYFQHSLPRQHRHV